VSADATIADVLAGRAQWCVIGGDCRAVPWPVVDHVITDPPYEAQAHTLQRRVARDVAPANAPPTSEIDSRGRKMEVEPLSFAPISEELRGWAGLEMARVAKRWIVAFCQVEAAVKWSEALAAGGATTKRIGVWVKPDGMPQFSGDRPGMGYESMVFAHRKGRSRWNGGGRVGVFIHNKHDERAGHETQKPLPLMLELVELFTDPGELVLDPFCGSGTTGVACLRLGRRFIGIERDAKYAAIARERLTAEGRGLSLRDARAGQTSIFDALAG
jgi:site-specific DNA-methyltransferase (adenine-specific)